MSKFFMEKSQARVLLVEPAGSVRLMISDVLRELGFGQSLGVASGKDALHVLEVEPVHWLIMPLLGGEDINALKILKLIIHNPTLRHIRTSLLLDPEADAWCLTQAFELGLLSWHKRSYVKESIQNDLSELLALLDLHSWNSTLTSAEYLRGFLIEKHHRDSRIALEQNLLSLFPGNPKVLLALAEAELDRGNNDKGERLLGQAELLDDKLKIHCKRLREKHGLPTTNRREGELPNVVGGENLLGIKTAVVIDPDTDILHSAKDLFTKVGVKNIEAFDNGQEAFEWLKASPEPDLIFMEWRIPGLAGPILTQRIRQLGFFQVPIIVASSLVKKEDLPLLKEMGCDDFLEKPFDHSAFYSMVIWAIQQSRAPTEQKSLERKIRALLEAKKVGEAERLIAQLISDERTSEASKKEIAAEFEFSKENFTIAADLAAEAIRLGGDSLLLLNLLGKCLMRLRKFDAALRCFEKAHTMSPLNIDRLLKMAEIDLEVNDPERAKAAIEGARKIDANNSLVAESQAKIAVEHGSLESASKLMDELESGNRLTAYMNNRAVSLIRNGRFEDGIALYKRAIEAIPPKWKDLKLTVQYNLALAHTRYSEHDQALEVLKVITTGNCPVTTKAKSLQKKIVRFQKTCEPVFESSDAQQIEELDINGDRASQEGEATDFSDLIAKVEAKRGDVGCYLIYRCIEGHDQRNLDLLKSELSFQRRKKILKK